jgi:hypothetical protein
VCGASLVRGNRLVTAAHCWFDGQNQASRFTVILGTVNLFSGGTRVATSSVFNHGSWNPSLIRNDIAMIHLASNVATSSESSSSSYPFPTLSGIGTICFSSCCEKIWQLFLRPAACLTSALLETGVGANDCKCSRDQRLNVPSQAQSINIYSSITIPTNKP